jgi:hypothetical protein
MSTDFSVVAIIAAYNEEDIIGQVLGRLVSQGVDVCFLDHGSTDGTLAEVQPYLGRGLLRVEQFRERSAGSQTDTGLFTWKSILRRKEALAHTLDASWFIHHDAGEFRESPWVHVTPREAIRAVDTSSAGTTPSEVRLTVSARCSESVECASWRPSEGGGGRSSTIGLSRPRASYGMPPG